MTVENPSPPAPVAPSSVSSHSPSRLQRALKALREGRLHLALLRRVATRLRLRARLWSLSGSRTGRRLLALWLQGKPDRQARLLDWLMNGRATAKPVEDRLNPPRSHTVNALYQSLLAQTLWGDVSADEVTPSNKKGA